MKPKNSVIGENVKIWHYTNIYNSQIGDNSSVGSYTEIGGTIIGENCSIQAFCYFCPGTVVEDDVFIGPRVTILNDKYPPRPRETWAYVTIKKGASIGGSVTILPGVTIGENAMIGAGSVVTKNVPNGEIWAGVPAKPLTKGV
jgi:acetyltransferase-like isoleucine patch superfamily enzyme